MDWRVRLGWRRDIGQIAIVGLRHRCASVRARASWRVPDFVGGACTYLEGLCCPPSAGRSREDCAVHSFWCITARALSTLQIGDLPRVGEDSPGPPRRRRHSLFLRRFSNGGRANMFPRGIKTHFGSRVVERRNVDMRESRRCCENESGGGWVVRCVPLGSSVAASANSCAPGPCRWSSAKASIRRQSDLRERESAPI